MSIIAGFFVEGGPFMYPILAALILGIAIMIERFIFLFLKYNINAKAFMAQVQKLVMANNIDRAIKLCNAAPSAALPRVMKAGLTRANRGRQEIEEAIEEAQLEIIPIIQKRTQNLNAIAASATMMGLLGTVVGLIQGFAAVASAAPDQKAAMLTGAIAIAMNTTAFGLIVAIPCQISWVVYGTVTKKMMDEIEEYSVKLVHMLGQRAKGMQA